MRASTVGLGLYLLTVLAAIGCNGSSGHSGSSSASTVANTQSSTTTTTNPSPSPSPAASPSPSPSPSPSGSGSSFLYVASAVSDTITTFNLDPASGAPSNPVDTPLIGNLIPGAAVFHVNAIAVDPTSKLMFAAGYTTAAIFPPTNGIAVLPIQLANGVLTPGTYVAPGNQGMANAVAISPANNMIYAVNAFTAPAVTPGGTSPLGGITSYSYDATGALTQGVSVLFGTAGPPTAAAIDATGAFLYATDTADGTVTGFGIGATGFTGNSVPSVVQTSGPVSLSLDSNANTLVTGNANGTLSVWNVTTPGTPALSLPDVAVQAGGTAAGTGVAIAAVALDPTGSFAVTANGMTGDVSLLWVNNVSPTATGPLVGTWTYPGAAAGATTSPMAVAWNASGTVVYVSETTTNTVAALAVSSTTGLTPLTGTPFALPAGDQSPVSLAVSR